MLFTLHVVAAATAVKLYVTDGITANATHRFAVIKEAATTGALKPGVQSALVPVESLPGGAGHCIALKSNVLYHGPPPRVCRRGTPTQGDAVNGMAQLMVVTKGEGGASINTQVRFPGPDAGPLQDTFTVGPFRKCYPAPALDAFAGTYCSEADASGWFINGNTSIVWANPRYAVPDDYLGVYCAMQVYALAMLAASANPAADIPLLQLAADTAIGGAAFQAWAVGSGAFIPGLPEELGDADAHTAARLVATITLVLAGLGWTVAWISTGRAPFVFGPGPNDSPLAGVRELLELPIMLSICCMWPGHLGRRFSVVLNMALGLAVPSVAGRAMAHFSADQSHYRLWAATMMLVAVVAGACLLLPSVAASGGVGRGTPAIVVTLTLAIHCTMGGYFITTRRRVGRPPSQ